MKYRPRRKPTDSSAVLVTEGGEYRVTLRDASPEGVRASGVDGYVCPEAEVKLVVRNQGLPGQVAWVDGHTVGIKFDRVLPKDLVAWITRGTGHAAPSRW